MIHYLAFTQQAFWSFALSTLAFILIVTALVTFLVFYHKKIKALFTSNSEIHKELLTMMVSSQEEESKRVASDLHDNIGGVLSVAGLYLDQAISNEEESCAEKQVLIEKSRKLINDAVNQIRKVSYNMRPYSIGQSGFQRVLQNLLWRTVDPAQVQLTCQFEDHDINFSEEKELLVYRVVQELIPYILKHSEPGFIHVRQYSKSGNFILEVIYDGKALDQQRFSRLIHESSDTGLKKMVSRLKVSDGELLFTKEDTINKAFFKMPYADVKSVELSA